MPTLPYTARFFVLRAPLLPRALAPALHEDPLPQLRALVQDPRVREALFVASADLEHGLAEWLRDPNRPSRVPSTLYRYLNRLCTRPIPFGLFAGCATGEVGGESALRLDDTLRRHTRVDMGLLTSFCSALEPELRGRLRYLVNTSAAPVGQQLRYAEGQVDPASGERHNDQISLQRSPAIDAALAACPATREALARVILAQFEGIEEEEALGFIDGLIEAQLLVAELEPPVTGDDPLGSVVRALSSVAPGIAERLRHIDRALAALDSQGVGQDLSVYAPLLGSLGALGQARSPLQVDLYRQGELRLSERAVQRLLVGVALLHQVSPSPESPELQRFIQRFDARWGQAEVPLALALDEELGIGFGAGRSADPSPLLAGLPFEEPERPRPFGPRERWLLRRVQEHPRVWRLDEADLAALRVENPPLPHSLTVLASFSGTPEAGTLHLSGAFGPNAAKLFGRFCQGDAALRAHVEALMQAEQALTPDALLAELVHLPEGRLGNVIARPVLRPVEIPYLGRGGAPTAIAVSALRLRLHQGRLSLHDDSGRRVLPTLCSAHHHADGDLPMYRFLAALSEQGVSAGLMWTWGALDAAPSLPRVCCGDVVLSPACWRLAPDELANLTVDSLAQLRARRGLPKRVCLSQGDNVLLLDLDHALAVESLAHLRGGALLTEDLLEEPALQGPGGAYAYELVVPMLRDTASTPLDPPPSLQPEQHLPGSGWLSAQLYAGTLGVDALLVDLVAPLVARWRAEGRLAGWFFVRYADPDWHLRLRLRTPDAGGLLTELEAALRPLAAEGGLAKLSLAPYQPEIARYGGPEATAICERIFEADSEATVALLAHLEGDADARWRLALRSVHCLLDDLGLSLPERVALLARVRSAWGRVTGAGSAVDGALSQRFRAERPSLTPLIAPSWPEDHPLGPGLALYAARSQRVRVLGERLRRSMGDHPIDGVVESLIHMAVNRLARSDANRLELVIYDWLGRLYRSALARRGV